MERKKFRCPVHALPLSRDHAQPTKGRRMRGSLRRPAPWLFCRCVDLVERASVGKMGFLGLLPAAEILIDGIQFFYLGQSGWYFFVDRPVVMLGSDLLTFVSVKVLQVFFCHLAGSVSVHHLVDHGDRRFSQDAFRRGYD